jgi:hypothetical protein
VDHSTLSPLCGFPSTPWPNTLGSPLLPLLRLAVVLIGRQTPCGAPRPLHGSGTGFLVNHADCTLSREALGAVAAGQPSAA